MYASTSIHVLWGTHQGDDAVDAERRDGWKPLLDADRGVEAPIVVEERTCHGVVPCLVPSLRSVSNSLSSVRTQSLDLRSYNLLKEGTI
jgi:hypothetical protein